MKALKALVYVFLSLVIIAAIASLFFLKGCEPLKMRGIEDKHKELSDRNRMQEKYYLKIARTIESESKPEAKVEVIKDISPVEDRLVDSPEKQNLLEEYDASVEEANLTTFDWSGKTEQLRMIYKLNDETGLPERDGDEFVKEAPGTEFELLEQLSEAAKAQQAKLNNTRAQLKRMRERLEQIVSELNSLKPIARQDKVTIVQKNEKIAALEGEKSELADKITKLNAEVDELNTQITSKNDEIARAKSDLEAKNEELLKEKKLVKELQQLVKDLMNNHKEGEMKQMVSGDKAVVVEVNNDKMYAIVKFSDEAMMELKGVKLDRPIPFLTLGVKRAGYNGPAGEFVGRLRLRQEVKGKNFVICDILGDWSQATIEKDDVVFAD